MNKNEIKDLTLKALGYNETPEFVNSDDNGVRLLNETYEHYFTLCLSKNKWSFFVTQTELERIDHDQKYRYRYETPDDMDFLNGIYHDNKFSNSITSYEMYDKNIFTDAHTCFMDYSKKKCEDLLPPYFVEFFSLHMAYKLCHNITGDTALEQSLYQKSELAFKEAKSLDNLQKQVKVLDSSVFIVGR